MVERNVSSQRFVVAGIVTLLIFALGVLLGVIIDYERVQSLESDYRLQELDYKSLQLQFTLLSSENSNASCSAFEKAMESTVAELGDSLEAVERYREFSLSQEDDFDVLERSYILDNLRYWLLVRQSHQFCPMRRLPILYFYSEENCDICPNQGVVLTYFKKRLGDTLLVFPINADRSAEEPMVRVIMTRFEVDEYPSLVVGENTYKGVVERDELSHIICSEMGPILGECE